MFWLFFSVIVLFLAYWGDPSNWQNKNANHAYIYVQLILAVVLAYLIGFGGLIGQDHEPYAYFFNSSTVELFRFDSLFDYGIGTKIDAFEPGFVLLTKLIYLLGFGEAGYFFIIAFVTNFLLIKVFYRFKWPVLIFLIYITSIYYSQQMNIVRQMLCVSCFLYSLKFIEEKRWKIYVGIISLLSLVHMSAITLLVFTLFCFKNPKDLKFTLFLLVFWSFSVFVAITKFQIPILNFIPQGHDYNQYMNSSDAIGSTAVFNVFYNFFVLYCFVLVYFKKTVMNLYSMIFILGCIILNFSVSLTNLMRYSYYYTPLYCAMVPYIIFQSKKTKINIFSSILLVLIGLYYSAVLIFQYIFNQSQLMGSEFYHFADFIR